MNVRKENIMKAKKLFLCATLATACIFSLIGCSSSSSSDDVKVIEGTADTTETTDASTGSSGYVFTYQGTEIPVDADAADIIEALGEPNSYFEAESCAAQGIGKHYTYNDIEIETYPDGDTDRILYVMLKSDAVSTAEGINISSTKDDILEAYGEPTEEITGSLVYEKDSMKLKFLFDGDSIISIEYDSPLA